MDVRAGLLYTMAEDGARLAGDPAHFTSDNGLSGESLLSALLEAPTCTSLYHGAKREALAAAHAALFFGFQETRAWDSQSLYIIDNTEGDIGAILFENKDCVGVISDHNANRIRPPDQIASRAPYPCSTSLNALLKLPLLQTPNTAITSAFWSVGGRVESDEPWHEAFRNGAELLRREVMDDAEWMTSIREQYSIGTSTAMLMIDIVSRNDSEVVVLSNDDLTRLFPKISSERDEILAQLLRSKAFTIR